MREQALDAVRNEIVAQWEAHQKQQQKEKEEDQQQEQQRQGKEQEESDEETEAEEKSSSSSPSSTSCSSSTCYFLQDDLIAAGYQKAACKAQHKAHQDALKLERDVVQLSL